MDTGNKMRGNAKQQGQPLNMLYVCTLLVRSDGLIHLLRMTLFHVNL
jgi:hypothetical protein